jgi:hypothetical protein
VAGALCGTVLLLAGVLAGYLADGAIELQAVSAADRNAATVHAALLTADARWNILAAAVAAAGALAAFVPTFLSMLAPMTSAERALPGNKLIIKVTARRNGSLAGRPIMGKLFIGSDFHDVAAVSAGNVPGTQLARVAVVPCKCKVLRPDRKVPVPDE